MNPYASYVTRTFLRIFLLILLTAIFYSCNPTEKGKISVDFGEFKDKVAKNNQNFSPQITSAVLINDELKITGTDLSSVKSFSLSGIGSDKDLYIITQADTEVTLSSGSPFALLLDTTLSLILEDAYGNTTVVGITFNLPDNAVTTDKIADGTIVTADLKDGAVTSAKLDSMGASTGQFLKYTGAGWAASDLQALTYAGNFDASGAPLAAGNPNEYYIVTVAGSADLAGGNGTDSWQIGDWAVWNDPAGQWEKIEKGSGVTSFNTRNGPVTAQAGDYDWSMIGNLAGAYLDYRPNNVPCADGTLLAWDNSNSRWDCFTLPADQNTTYTAGTGLDLTGTVFSIASQGVTNTMISGIASNCSSGQVLKADGAGGFSCAADAGAGGADASSLRGEALDTNLATNTTTDGQILIWSQTNNRWEVGTDQNTTYTAGTGLTLATTTFNVDVGTTTGKIVQLDGTGLPAVDGSQLTGLTKTQVGLSNVSNSLQLLDSNKVTVIDSTSDNTAIPSALAVKNYVDGSAVTSLTVDQINSGAGLYFGYLPNNVACTPGQVLEWDNANSRWVCGTKTVDTDTTYSAGTGLTLSTTTFNVDVGTGANQIVQLDGAAALPAVDGSNLTDVVAVSADTALAVENDNSVVINADNTGDNTGDINFQINSTTRATLLNNGNFGLGTTTPLAKFEVVAPASDGILIPNGNALLGRGSSGITQILYWGSNTAYWGRNTSDVPGGTGDVVNSHFFRTNGTDRLSIISNGNVGVGTITPQSKLDVSGVIRAEQICDETGANCHDLSAGTNTSGTVTSVATGSGLTGGPITSTGTISVDVGTTANKIPQLDGSGKLVTSVETDPTVEAFAQTTLPTCGIGEVLKGDGTNLTCVTDANTTYTGGTGIGIDGSQVITVTQSDINTDNITEGTTNLFSQWGASGSDLYYNSGNVGIGVISPASRLHVNQNTNGATVASITGYTGNSGTNNVALDVRANNDNASGSTILQLTHTNPAGGSPNNLSYLIRALGDIHGDGDNTSSDDVFHVTTAGQSYFGGYVGIGTTAPEAPLHVRESGNGNAVVFEDNSSVGASTSVAIRNGGSGSSSLKFQGGSTTYADILLPTSANHLRFRADTFSYTTLLNAQPYAYLELFGDGGRLRLQNRTGPQTNIDLRANGPSFLNGGNVGIGTSTPGSKLDVNGTIRATEICNEDGSVCHDMTNAIGTSSTTGTVTSITGGAGLSDGPITNSGTIDVNVDDSTIEINTDALRLKDGGITNSKVSTTAAIDYSKLNIADGNLTIAKTNGLQTALDAKALASRSIASGDGLSGGGDLSADRTLAVNVDNSTIEINADTLRVKDGGITNAKIATVADTKLTTACSDGQALTASSGNFVCANSSSLGNWTLSGSDIYYNSGNVGIGSTNPGVKLEISGPFSSNKTVYNVAEIGPIGTNNNNKITIRTKIPWSGGHGPAGQIRVKSYGYSSGPSMDFLLEWYQYLGAFYALGNVTAFHSRIGSKVPSSVRMGTWDDAGTLRVAVEVTSSGNEYWTSYTVDLYRHSGISVQNASGWVIDNAGFDGTVTNIVNLPQEGAIIQDSLGNLGIGTASPATKLDVAGEVKVGSTGITCNASSEGATRYNSTLKRMEFCNGTAWNDMTAPIIPSGAIMPFDLTSCPSGWSEYTAAYGRVIRGIDKSGGSVDPDGQRAPGSTQEDALQQHNHYITSQTSGQDNVVAFSDTNSDATYANGGDPGSRGDVYLYVGNVKTGRTAVETRSKNVALLYCRKN